MRFYKKTDIKKSKEGFVGEYFYKDRRFLVDNCGKIMEFSKEDRAWLPFCSKFHKDARVDIAAKMEREIMCDKEEVQEDREDWEKYKEIEF